MLRCVDHVVFAAAVCSDSLVADSQIVALDGATQSGELIVDAIDAVGMVRDEVLVLQLDQKPPVPRPAVAGEGCRQERMLGRRLHVQIALHCILVEFSAVRAKLL
jgi:hypothetical protein